MSFAFPEYVKIKDNYCCAYLGNTAEYVVQLKLLRLSIEEQLPGIRLHLCCRDSLFYLLEDEPRTLRSSELHGAKHNFAYIRTLTYEDKHPVLEFMEESQLAIPAFSTSKSNSGMALICPEGMNPTQSLKPDELETVKKRVAQMGYTVVALGSDIHSSLSIPTRPFATEKFDYIKLASVVVGVENEYLYLAGGMGKDTMLISTGVGTELYKKMFPGNKILKI